MSAADDNARSREYIEAGLRALSAESKLASVAALVKERNYSRDALEKQVDAVRKALEEK